MYIMNIIISMIYTITKLIKHILKIKGLNRINKIENLNTYI